MQGDLISEIQDDALHGDAGWRVTPLLQITEAHMSHLRIIIAGVLAQIPPVLLLRSQRRLIRS